jgi:exopolyphosphatase/guanosine-5'-triphosphate,3'-diphosphate pyrophosphatase
MNREDAGITPAARGRGRSSRRKRGRGTRAKAAPRRSPLLAAIDLGTNNCRLLIATIDMHQRLHVRDSFSRIVRLGEGVAETGLLSESAVGRTIEALKICAARVRRARAVKVRAIVTEAARQARNADLLIARAKAEAGVALEIVTAEEEARLAAIGCAPLIGRDYEGALVFDIGGGSTEIAWMKGHHDGARMLASASVPLGVVSMAERKGEAASFAAMRDAAQAALDGARRAFDKAGRFNEQRYHLLGTSGTVTTLAGIALKLPRYDRARVDGSWHDSADILQIVDRLSRASFEERAAIGCVGRDRADLIVPGCAIFSAIGALWPCERLRVADRGLREGMLRELAAG